MNQEQIRAKYQELLKKLRDLETQKQHISLDMQALQRECKHKNRLYSYCPDCEASWGD